MNRRGGGRCSDADRSAGACGRPRCCRGRASPGASRAGLARPHTRDSARACGSQPNRLRTRMVWTRRHVPSGSRTQSSVPRPRGLRRFVPADDGSRSPQQVRRSRGPTRVRLLMVPPSTGPSSRKAPRTCHGADRWRHIQHRSSGARPGGVERHSRGPWDPCLTGPRAGLGVGASACPTAAVITETGRT
jgi:hypothetical protein